MFFAYVILFVSVLALLCDQIFRGVSTFSNTSRFTSVDHHIYVHDFEPLIDVKLTVKTHMDSWPSKILGVVC